MAFGDRLKEAREFAGYSRGDLANKLGVTKSAISNYENGVSSPKEDILLKIFDVLNVEPNYLFQDSFTKISLQQKERKIIEAYRRQPHLHEAVQKVLGIYNDLEYIKERATAYKIAARDGANTLELTPAQREELVKAIDEVKMKDRDTSDLF